MKEQFALFEGGLCSFFYFLAEVYQLGLLGKSKIVVLFYIVMKIDELLIALLPLFALYKKSKKSDLLF